MDVRREVTLHLNRAVGAHDYDAVDHLYQALVKASRAYGDGDEGRRVMAMLDALPEEALHTVLELDAVDALLDLDPPLETVLSDPVETLRSGPVADALAGLRTSRGDDPRVAVRHLAALLKRVRDKRYHGFKSVEGPRDAEILGAARMVLGSLTSEVLRDLGRQGPSRR